MKIAIDVSQMCYEGTGVARYVRELTLALLRLDTPHQFVLYAGALRQRSYFTKLSQQEPWSKAEWKMSLIPPKVAGQLFNHTSLKLEWFTGPVDLVHTSDWGHPSASVPLVTTVHDLVFVKYPTTVDPLILKTQTKRLKKIIASKAHIIADSQSTKNDLMEIYQLESSLIDVVYPGIAKNYSPQPSSEIERVKTKYKLPDRFILSLGTQEPRKNIPRLIEACSALDLPLVITGKYGWGYPTNNNSAAVISLGFVPDPDLPPLYSAASVFAYPSLYEGFGFPILEAMACGAPVVTSNLSSLPEIVGDAGILVNPSSVESIRAGIVTAMESSDTLKQRGLEQANKFSWERTAQQVLDVYEKITLHA